MLKKHKIIFIFRLRFFLKNIVNIYLNIILICLNVHVLLKCLVIRVSVKVNLFKWMSMFV